MRESLDFIKTISRRETKMMKNLVLPHLTNAYVHLEVPLPAAQKLALKTVQLSKSGKPIEKIELELHEMLRKNGAFRFFDEKMNLRAFMWYQKIEPFIVGKNFLDLGGGDGRTAQRAKNELRGKGKDIEVHVADVLDYPDRVRDIAYTRMEGTKAPFDDNFFDTVFLGTVYHHVGKDLDDPLKLVDESIRITKRRLVVIESIYQNPQERLYTMWIDWWYNRVLYFDKNPGNKVNVPFNFRTPKGWARVFKQRGMKIIKNVDLKIFQILNPEHHWLFVLEK